MGATNRWQLIVARSLLILAIILGGAPFYSSPVSASPEAQRNVFSHILSPASVRTLPPHFISTSQERTWVIQGAFGSISAQVVPSGYDKVAETAKKKWATDPFEYVIAEKESTEVSASGTYKEYMLMKKPAYDLVQLLGWHWNARDGTWEIELSYNFVDSESHGWFSMQQGWLYQEIAYKKDGSASPSPPPANTYIVLGVEPSLAVKTGAEMQLWGKLFDAAKNVVVLDKTLKFYVAGNYVGEGSDNSTGRVTIAYKVNLGPGSYEIKVAYNGDSSYGPGSETKTLVVEQAAVYSLTVQVSVDVSWEPLSGVEVTADGVTKTTSGGVATFPVSAGSHALSVSSTFGGRSFSHFYNETAKQDVNYDGPTSYTFNISGDHRVVTIYKMVTQITLNPPTVTSISGKLLNENSQPLIAQGKSTVYGSPPVRRMVTLEYYDGSWKTIGQAQASTTDGSFSYSWSQPSNATQVRASYTAPFDKSDGDPGDGIYYMPSKSQEKQVTTPKPDLTVEFSGWYLIDGSRVYKVMKGQVITAKVALSGGIAGSYTLRARRDRSGFAPDETVKEVSVAYSGPLATIEVTFEPTYAEGEDSTHGYHLDLRRDGNTEWTMPSAYPPRLAVFTSGKLIAKIVAYMPQSGILRPGAEVVIQLQVKNDSAVQANVWIESILVGPPVQQGRYQLNRWDSIIISGNETQAFKQTSYVPQGSPPGTYGVFTRLYNKHPTDASRELLDEKILGNAFMVDTGQSYTEVLEIEWEWGKRKGIHQHVAAKDMQASGANTFLALHRSLKLAKLVIEFATWETILQGLEATWDAAGIANTAVNIAPDGSYDWLLLQIAGPVAYFYDNKSFLDVKPLMAGGIATGIPPQFLEVKTPWHTIVEFTPASNAATIFQMLDDLFARKPSSLLGGRIPTVKDIFDQLDVYFQRGGAK